MPYAIVDDVKLYYQIYGAELNLNNEEISTNPSLIVLHGGPGLDHTYEIPFLSKCSEFSQVIFLDHRGNGRSHDDNTHHWNLERWGNDVYYFCEYLGIKKPFVIGDSFGGHVAMQYSILHPEHPAGVILVDTEGQFNIEELLNAYEKKGGQVIRDIAKNCFENPTEKNMIAYMQHCIPLCAVNSIPDSLFKYCIMKPEITRHYDRQELISMNLIPELKKIKAPVLYLASTCNPVHRLDAAVKTKESFSSIVEFVTFENCGLVSIDAREKAISLIKDFVLKYHKNI